VTVSFSVSYGVLWALVIFQSLVLLGMTRTVYQLRANASPEGEALGPDSEIEGAPTPIFSSTDVFGTGFDSAQLGDQLAAFLFVSPGCSNCVATLNHLEALKRKVDGRVVVVCRGDDEACRNVAETYNTSVPVLSDEDLEINKRFGAPAAPAAILVEGGRIRSVGHPSSGDDLEQMLEKHTAQAPELALQVVSGDGAGR
jgi:peroxiredoxin